MDGEFETVELEYSEEDILYYLVDEDDNEIGFVIEEDGREVECYYEGFDAEDYEVAADASDGVQAGRAGADEGRADGGEPDGDEPDGEPGYLYKMAAIAGHEGDKARKKAEAQLDRARGAAEKQFDKAKKAAGKQAGRAKKAADEMDLGITREGVAETTADLNAIAKEGAEAAKELKEAYDDIMGTFGWIAPKRRRR